MLEAILWITGFFLILLLTWFMGKYCAEKMATKKILKRRDIKDKDLHSSPLKDFVTDVSQEQVTRKCQGRSGNTKLRLATVNGKLLDPEDRPTDNPSVLNNASK